MIHDKHISKFLVGCLLSFFCLFIISGCTSMKQWFTSLPDGDNLRTAEQLDEKDLKKFMYSVRPVHGDPDSQYRLARHFQKQGNHEIAVEELIKLLKIHPDSYNAYNALGVSYDNLKQYDLAIDAYTAALKINPDLGYVHNNIGYSYLLKGDLEAAAESFETAIALNGQNKTYQNNLALARAKAGPNTSLTADTTPLEKQELTPMPETVPIATETVEKDTDTVVGKTLDTIVEKDLDTVVEKNLDTTLDTTADASKKEAIQSPIKNALYYAIQLGAYLDLNNAVRSLKNAQEKGYDCPYIIKIEKEKPYKPYYRVRFGKYQTREDAETLAANIMDNFGKKALTIAETYPIEVFHAKAENQCRGVNIEQIALKETLKIEVLNGNGIYRMAARVSDYFTKKGLTAVHPANAAHFNYQTTKIYYTPGYYQDARKLAEKIPGFEIAGKFIESSDLNTDIRVLIGKDIARFNEELKKSMKI